MRGEIAWQEGLLRLLLRRIKGMSSYCYCKRLQRLEMAGKDLGAVIRKLFMSSVSSTMGIGTVLGLHAAMLPKEARIQDSTQYNPTIDESKSLMKIDFVRGQGYLAIALFTLLYLLPLHSTAALAVPQPSSPRKRRR